MKPAAQMYTLRDYTKKVDDLSDSLRLVSEMGYESVQLSAIGAWDQGLIDAAGLRALLDKHGLSCCATHRSVKRLLEATAEEIDIHRTLGCDYVAVGGIAGDYGMEPESYRRFGSDFAPVIASLKEAGIRFGFHNHAHEFRQGGKDHYDLLFDVPDLMLEIDTYWVAVAGLDPKGLLKRAVGKIPVIHVKDLEIVDWSGPKYAPVGEGNLDWSGILGAAKDGGTEWLVVEQDECRRDPFDCLASSLHYLQAHNG